MRIAARVFRPRISPEGGLVDRDAPAERGSGYSDNSHKNPQRLRSQGRIVQSHAVPEKELTPNSSVWPRFSTCTLGIMRYCGIINGKE